VGAKYFFKQLLTTLDEALMRDAHTKGPQQTSTLEVPPTEPEPATEDPNTDTVALTSTRTMISLDVSGEIYTILHPTHQLIDSPQRIEASQLQPFLNGSREITLVFAQGGKALPGTLHSIYPTYLEADSDTSTFRHQRGETVLVVFRVPPQPHYVLQTVIDKVYAFRLKLQYGSPRYEARQHFPLAVPVRLSLAPPLLITAIAKQQVRIVREITLLSGGIQGGAGGCITDWICESLTLRSSHSPFANAPTLSCTLEDISLGGVCLALEHASEAEELLHRLVLLNISLPSAPEAPYPPLTLQLLGGIRGIGHTLSSQLLHVRFLRRLPKEIDALLEYLEGHCVGV
jgi:hypothetical protein